MPVRRKRIVGQNLLERPCPPVRRRYARLLDDAVVQEGKLVVAAQKIRGRVVVEALVQKDVLDVFLAEVILQRIAAAVVDQRHERGVDPPVGLGQFVIEPDRLVVIRLVVDVERLIDRHEAVLRVGARIQRVDRAAGLFDRRIAEFGGSFQNVDRREQFVHVRALVGHLGKIDAGVFAVVRFLILLRRRRPTPRIQEHVEPAIEIRGKFPRAAAKRHHNKQRRDKQRRQSRFCALHASSSTRSTFFSASQIRP